MNPASTLLVCVDETPIDLGGSGYTHVSAPAGVEIYVDEKDPRFSKMQWAGACSNTRVTRPWHVWNKEDETISDNLNAQLVAAKTDLAIIVDNQRSKA